MNTNFTGSNSAAAAIGPCPVCTRPSRRRVFEQTLLGKHQVDYFYCEGCGLLQTEAPHWLDEAYQTAIADTDTGILARNLSNARLLNVLLQRFFKPEGRFVDVAGGYGLLTRLLRDQGFDCWRIDKYCENLFADGFDAPPSAQAEALFAFEVLEHVPDPVAFVAGEFERHGCRSLVFSTLTFGPDLPPMDWWYYSLESGQHISFYQVRTLSIIADRLGCHYVRIDNQHHVISKEPMGRALRAVISRPRTRGWAESYLWSRGKRPSLTWADHEAAKQRLLVAQGVAAQDIPLQHETPRPSP